MGKPINGIHGHYIGKVGNIVGSSRNGQYYLKGVPVRKTKRNNKPKTENQSRFSVAHYWLQPLLNFVRVGYKDYKQSGEFNAAKSYVLNHAIESRESSFAINPALVMLSKGDLPLSNDIAVSKVDDNKLQFTWTFGGADEKASGADQVMMVAYDTEKGSAHIETTGQFRKTGSDTLRVIKGGKYQVYMAFTSSDRTSQSDSVYLGEVEM